MVEHFILSGFYERCSECSSCLRRKKIACSTRNDRVAECTSLLGGDGEEMERIGNFCKPKKIKSKQIKSKQSTESYKETENAFSAPLFVPISATARASLATSKALALRDAKWQVYFCCWLVSDKILLYSDSSKLSHSSLLENRCGECLPGNLH